MIYTCKQENSANANIERHAEIIAAEFQNFTFSDFILPLVFLSRIRDRSMVDAGQLWHPGSRPSSYPVMSQFLHFAALRSTNVTDGQTNVMLVAKRHDKILVTDHHAHDVCVFTDVLRLRWPINRQLETATNLVVGNNRLIT